MTDLLSSHGNGFPMPARINPDCGLKTRKWEEVRPALVNMVPPPANCGRCITRQPVRRSSQASLKGYAMRFWIECTRFETGQATHINIALVGSLWREGERTVLAFVGGDAARIEVTNAGADMALHLARSPRHDGAMR